MLGSFTKAQLGHYALVRELRRDVYGIVYEAKDLTDNHPVLLRALAPEITNSDNFIVRFELLKRILPNLRHPNILQYRALGYDQNVHFTAQQYPAPANETPRTLDQCALNETPNRYRTLFRILEGVAQGLLALEEFRDHYFSEGILHDALRPDRIYLEFEKALIGSAAKPLPRIGAVAESFLFYGDAPQSSLSYRLAPYLQEQHGNYLAYEHLLPPELRRAEHKPPWLHLYSYGALTYILFTGHAARGSFPPITESDPNIDPTWDEIVRECLRAPFGGGWTSMKQVITALRSIALRFNEATPTERMLQELSIPPGMSLVLFQDKVELGAADGPLTEQPRFRARIHPFFIDSTPVTVAEFREFLPSYRPSPYSSQPDSPATMISWHMAKGYCKWRSEKEGLPPDTYRLPTEYEWEAACRGMEGDQYPWGAEPDVRRIYCGQATDKGTLPVRALAPGRYGLYGMLGNVWEWTESVFKPHPFSKHHEAGYDAGLRTIKGGCWITPLHQCRGSARGAFAPNERRGNVGFRCARLVEEKNG